MKKILSVLLVCVICVGTVLSLVSCGGALSGKYEGTLCDLEFSGDDVTIYLPTADASVSGTYEIKEKDDGAKTISIDVIENNDNKYLLNIVDAILGVDVPFEEEGDTIKIGFFKFTKK